MPNTATENAKGRAKELSQGIKQLKVHLEGKELASISVSIGIASFPDYGITYEQLIRLADEALYQAKQNRRDCVCYIT